MLLTWGDRGLLRVQSRQGQKHSSGASGAAVPVLARRPAGWCSWRPPAGPIYMYGSQRQCGGVDWSRSAPHLNHPRPEPAQLASLAHRAARSAEGLAGRRRRSASALSRPCATTAPTSAGQGVVGDTEPVGPVAPVPVVTGQSLADVEYHRADHVEQPRPQPRRARAHRQGTEQSASQPRARRPGTPRHRVPHVDAPPAAVPGHRPARGHRGRSGPVVPGW